jgi:hypothetical protein
LFGAVGEIEFEPFLAGMPVNSGSSSGGVVGEEKLVVDKAVGREAVGLVVGVAVGVDVVGEIALGEEGNLEVGGEGELVAETVEAEVRADVAGVVEAAAGLEKAVEATGGFEALGQGLAEGEGGFEGDAGFEAEGAEGAEGFFLDGIDGGKIFEAEAKVVEGDAEEAKGAKDLFDLGLD